MRIRVTATCGKGIFAGEDSAGNYCVFDQVDLGPVIQLGNSLVGEFGGEGGRSFDATNPDGQGNVTVLLQKWKCSRAEAMAELESFADTTEIWVL